MHSYRGSLSVIMPTTPTLYPSYRIPANEEDFPPTCPQTYIYIMFSRDRVMWAPGCGSDDLSALFYPSTFANVLSRTRAYIQTRTRESWERLSSCVRRTRVFSYPLPVHFRSNNGLWIASKWVCAAAYTPTKREIESMTGRCDVEESNKGRASALYTCMFYEHISIAAAAAIQRTLCIYYILAWDRVTRDCLKISNDNGSRAKIDRCPVRILLKNDPSKL